MFEFRNGMLGVTIIALAIAGAIVGGYLAGIESVEHDVTKFNYLADVSGLYEYDTSPQYIEYDPSSNYTGYYSTETGEWWPVDYVDYTNNDSINTYKVMIAPNIISQGETVPYDLTGYEEAPCRAIFIYNETDDYEVLVPGRESINRINSIVLSSYIQAMNLGSQVNYIEFKSNSPLEESALTSPAGFVIFSTKSQWTVYDDGGIFTDIRDLLIATDGYLQENNLKVGQKMEVGTGFGSHDLTIQKAYLSVSINLQTNIVNLYTTPDCTGHYDQSRLDEVYFSWGGNDDATSHTQLILDNKMSYSAEERFVKYLNPNYGVSLKE